MANLMIRPVGDKEADPQRSRILKISAALFAEKGYMAVGVAELGDRVGLGRGALYYHIGSKEELLFDIVSQYISELVATGSKIVGEAAEPRQKIERLSRHMMTVVSEHLAEMTVCFRESDCLTGDRHKVSTRLHAKYQALWSGVFEEGYAKGVFRQLPLVGIKGLLGMYYHSFLWLNPQGRSSATDIADVFSNIVLRALAVDDPSPGSHDKPTFKKAVSRTSKTETSSLKTSKTASAKEGPGRPKPKSRG